MKEHFKPIILLSCIFILGFILGEFCGESIEKQKILNLIEVIQHLK